MKRIILTVIVFAMLITSAGCSVGNNRTEAITTPEIEETYKIDEYMSDDKDNSNYHKNLMAYDGINGLCFDITLTEFVSRYNDTFWGIEDMELDGIETSSYQEGSALRNAILINRDIELVGINYDGDIEYYEENPLHRIYIPEFRFTVDGEERLNTVLLQMPTDLSGGYPADVLEQLLTREQAQDILRYGYGGMVLMACGISAALESPDTQSLTETLCDKFSTIKQMIDQVYMDMPFQKVGKPGGESVGIDGLSVPLCEQSPGLYPLVSYLLFLLLLPTLIVRQQGGDRGAHGQLTDTGLCLRVFGNQLLVTDVLRRAGDR